IERAVTRLVGVTLQAAEALERNLTCGKPAAENKAAELILSQAFRGTEFLDLALAIEDLKRQLAEVRRRHGDGNTDPGGGQTEGDAAPADPAGPPGLGPDPRGPEPGPDPGEDDPGPLADGLASFDL